MFAVVRFICGTEKALTLSARVYFSFISSVGIGIASTNTASKIIPVRIVPVESVRNPTIRGPVKPPIAPMEKRIPEATPTYLAPTCGRVHQDYQQ